MSYQTLSFYSKLKEIEQKQRFGHTLDSFLKHSERVIFLNFIEFEVLAII